MPGFLLFGLSAEGYAVDYAQDGDEALWLAENYTYEAIILDVMMPVRDGFTIARSLRRKDNQTPVLFLTAKGEIEDRVRGLDVGGDDYMVKPFSVVELLARLRTAVDLAKESADIVMLEKDLSALVDAVVEGRRNSTNIIKYIKMAASSNFGNILTVLGSSAFLPFLPMLPLQLLVQNLLYDISQTTIPFDPVDREDLTAPRRWETNGIARFMLFLGPISSVFDLVTFALLWFVFEANTIEKQALFQSGWFVEGLLSQTLIVHMIRTRRIPFFQSPPCAPLLLNTIVVMAIGAILPFTAVGAAIGFVRLPLAYFFWLVGILCCYCLLVQTIKIWYLRKFKSWIYTQRHK